MLHPLYVIAIAADVNLTDTVKRLTGRNRWTLKTQDSSIPEIKTALLLKYSADEAWLSVIRNSRIAQESK